MSRTGGGGESPTGGILYLCLPRVMLFSDSLYGLWVMFHEFFPGYASAIRRFAVGKC